MRASNSWTIGLNARRKLVAVRDRSVSWHGMHVGVCLLSDDGRTFKIDMSVKEAESLAASLTKYAETIKASATYRAELQLERARHASQSERRGGEHVAVDL